MCVVMEEQCLTQSHSDVTIRSVCSEGVPSLTQSHNDAIIRSVCSEDRIAQSLTQRNSDVIIRSVCSEGVPSFTPSHSDVIIRSVYSEGVQSNAPRLLYCKSYVYIINVNVHPWSP